jgi:hypothetical protein
MKASEPSSKSDSPPGAINNLVIRSTEDELFSQILGVQRTKSFAGVWGVPRNSFFLMPPQAASQKGKATAPALN